MPSKSRNLLLSSAQNEHEIFVNDFSPE